MSPCPLPLGRQALLEDPATNRSLLFDRGVGTYDERDWTLGAERKEAFLAGFVERFTGDLSHFVERRARAFEDLGAKSCSLITQDRLVVGLGLPQPIETGFLFDRLTGCPFVPGSSVKGLLRGAARLAARGELAIAGKTDAPDFWRDNLRRLFGPENEADTAPAQGDLVVYDAFPDHWPQLELDVLTPHYGEDPADWNDPTPVPFLTVAPGTAFRFHFRFLAVASADMDADQVLSLLRAALDALGIGGKKSAGYGAFGETTPPRPRVLALAQGQGRDHGTPFSDPPRPPRPPDPVLEPVAKEVRWKGAMLVLHEGKPTVMRGGKPVASCAAGDLEPALLAALRKHKKVRADVEVMKVGGPIARLARVTSWKV